MTPPVQTGARDAAQEVFVDTSALYALLDHRDQAHEAARAILGMLQREQARLTSTNYVVLESAVIAQRRLGLEAVATLHNRMVPMLSVRWVDRGLHAEALSALLAGSRAVSLVDQTSFAVMRREGVARAFAFDDDFESAGFVLCAQPDGF